MPNPQILLTYRLAALFKVVGVMTAILAGTVTIWQFSPPFYRWWSAGLSALILLMLLAPWWKWFHIENPAKLAHRLLILSLGWGLITPHFELLHAVYQPYQDLYAYPQFVEILKFTPHQVNNIHGFGQMFIIVPVIVATWQYRFKGMVWTLGGGAAGFVGIALLMPADAFNWFFYSIWGFVLLGVSLIVALVTWMLVEAMRVEQEKLAQANLKLAEQALLMEEFAATRERNRLARELHDTIAHSISGATVQLQGVQTLLKVDPKAAEEELVLARNQLKDGLSESRRAIATLRASPLDEFGLLVALEKDAQAVGKQTGMVIEADLEGELFLTDAEEQAIYRILTSAMNNVERHSEAQEMQIKLSIKDGRPLFVVRDNGRGFEPSTEIISDRYGILGMHERATLIGAELSIDSRIGKGTEVVLFLDASPLHGRS